MRYPLPSSNVNPSHQDHPALRDISEEILRLGGGQGALVREIGLLLRQCIDEVLKTPKTGRYRYEELERVEKTYIGQLVEIEIRSLLQLQKGKLLDVVILNREVDIKHTMGNNWMIPPEAVDRVCLLVAADEERLRCYFGAFVARPEYLTSAGNRDKKRTISASGFENIFWIFSNEPFPGNFWRNVPQTAIERIFSGTSGNRRVETLFRELLGVPIPREVINAVARQVDFTRRIRSDEGKGVRDTLRRDRISLLNGKYDRSTIAAEGLPACKDDEWIAARLQNDPAPDAGES